MKTIFDHTNAVPVYAVFMIFLLQLAGCTTPNQSLPQASAVLHLDSAGREVFRDGFHAGLRDKREHLVADHKRHSFPRRLEEAFRSGYITGLTYYWFFVGKESRVRKEYPQYLDAYNAPFREPALTWVIAFRHSDSEYINDYTKQFIH